MLGINYSPETQYRKRANPKSALELKRYRKIEMKAFDMATDSATLQLWSDLSLKERTINSQLVPNEQITKSENGLYMGPSVHD